MFKILKKQEGFTLVELLVVIAVIGILATIAMPRFNGFKDRAKEAAYMSELQLLRQTISFIEIEGLEFSLESLQRYLGEEVDVNNGTYNPGGGERVYNLLLQTSESPNYLIATLDEENVEITVTRNSIIVDWK